MEVWSQGHCRLGEHLHISFRTDMVSPHLQSRLSSPASGPVTVQHLPRADKYTHAQHHPILSKPTPASSNALCTAHASRLLAPIPRLHHPPLRLDPEKKQAFAKAFSRSAPRDAPPNRSESALPTSKSRIPAVGSCPAYCVKPATPRAQCPMVSPRLISRHPNGPVFLLQIDAAQCGQKALGWIWGGGEQVLREF
jgi:hypothetical protein